MRENPVNIAVLVSGGGTNLQALIDAQNSGIIKSGKIELVIANNANAFALERAKKAGIKTAICNKKELGSRFETELISVLEENKTDITLTTSTLPTTTGTHTIFVTLTLDTGEQIEYSTDYTFE